jgi:NAD-dependent deacetylase
VLPLSIPGSNNLGDTESLIKQAADLLRRTHRGVALTGAGHSTPSGIPDFRSPSSGLWEKVNPFEVASIFGFRLNPQAFFDWIRPLTYTMLNAEPNPAHHALAQLEKLGHLRAVITQNIDGLHTLAGSQRVYELHGHMREATCVECFKVYDAASVIPNFLETGDIPRCPACQGILKPNVILFGEQLPVDVLRASQRAAKQCDAMIVVGSSLSVAPASELPLMALAHGAKLIIVNYEPTYIDAQADIVIHDDLAYVVPGIVEELTANKDGHSAT